MAGIDKKSRIIIIGAGVFGLATALELAKQDFDNVLVLDRAMPPVPDGSSADISRIIRFDYADPTYMRMAKEAYDLWNTSDYNGIFQKSPFALVANNQLGAEYIDKCTSALTSEELPWTRLESAEGAKKMFPALPGALTDSEFQGYCNAEAGWADASKAIGLLRDQCLNTGVKFRVGTDGTVIQLQTDPETGNVTSVNTKSGKAVEGDVFILAAGAWTPRLVPMYNNVLATGQVIGFMKLTDDEMKRLEKLPIYINFSSGWFCSPPHQETKYLKCAVHGWGYTNTTQSRTESVSSAPPQRTSSARADFVPADGLERLRKGLAEVLPELADREFDRAAVCWYTDTPTGDFIVDYQPDHKNVMIATGGSGHAFKFLPVIGRYTVQAMQGRLPEELKSKWRFTPKHERQQDAFQGDGSRGGPQRREFTAQERSKL